MPFQICAFSKKLFNFATAGKNYIPNAGVIADAHLPAHHHVVADFCASWNSGLLGANGVASDSDVVGHLHEVVNLGAFADSRSAQRPTRSTKQCPIL
jgi:hypothetical protein